MSAWWNRLRSRYAALIEVYGTVAIATYLAIAAVVFVTFVVALRLGLTSMDRVGRTGTFVAAWVGLKATQPIRIGVTLVLTPFVARFWRGPLPRPDEPDLPPQ